MAFPDELGGLPYIPEELPQTTNNTTSEQLPTGEVTHDAEIVEPAQSSEATGEKTEEEKARQALEIKIKELSIDRELVKEYLKSIEWITEKDGKLSMTTLSYKNLKIILGKWDSFINKVSEYFDKKNAEAA